MAASDSRVVVAKPWNVRARWRMPVHFIVATLALACGVAVPLWLSADVWAYAAYGALVGHGVDPWAHAFTTSGVAPYADPLLDAALRAWDGSLPRDIYGPLFTLPVAAVVAATRRLSPLGTVTVLRALSSGALLVCIALAQRRRPRLMRLLALHPVVLWSAAEGHNDAFWLAAVLLADRLRSFPARCATLVAAVAIKLVAVVALGAALLRTRGRTRVAGVIIALVALVIAYAPLLRSLAAHGLDHGPGPPRVSLVHATALATWSGSTIPLWCAGVCALLGVAALRRAWRTADVSAGVAFAAWLLLPAPEPWYATWLVAVVALSGPTPAARALLAASFTGLALYVQDVVPATVLHDPALLGGTMLAVYVLPLIVALATAAPSPQPQPLPPPATPIATPTAAPSPAATTTPVPPTPNPSASPAPSSTPNLFSYVVDPTPGPSGMPQIIEIALNDRVMHKGGMMLVKVTTSTDVTSVKARTFGREIAVPQGAPGYFAGQEQLPDGIPFFLLNRTYQIEFVATTADGRSASFSLPLRLER
jgi:hypothetical protein